MDISTITSVSTLKALLKDEGLKASHPDIQARIAVLIQKPKVTVPEDQKIPVNHEGFSCVVYLNKRYVSPVSYKGRRLFQDSKFGGSPVIYENDLKAFTEFMGKVAEVLATHK
jgi:hypothetical protein